MEFVRFPLLGLLSALMITAASLAGSASAAIPSGTSGSSSLIDSEPATAYFMTVFAWEDPRINHTFATFMKVKSRDPNFESIDAFQAHTISWLPLGLTFNPWGQAERGKNFSLLQTLDEARHRHDRLTAFGPYRSTPRLYNKAITQIHRLENGGVKYKVIDTVSRELGGALQAVHAVTDIDTSRGLVHTGSLHGEPASRRTVLHFIPEILNPMKSYDRLMDHLGTDGYEIQKKDITPEEINRYRSG